MSRGYHQLTSYYNIYFNGNEAMKSGLAKIEIQIEEDYTKILPIFKESLPQTGTIVASDMDVAIEKATKLIKLHSMTKPPKNKKQSPRKRKPVKKEYNKFVDDAYIMMGRGFLYKKDFFRAHATFSLIIRDYKDDPVKYDAYIWLIRTLVESGRYTEAGEVIAMLEKEKEFPKALEGELAVAAAFLHMSQNKYDDAIAYLDIGIKKIKGNKRKTRYNYILAQLYQETGKNYQALAAYRQVVKRRPDYEMMFNARISSAQVMSGDGNATELKKELNRMRRQRRNARYLDQIYYALGNIAQNEGKIKEAVDLYKQSVAHSSVNIHQRALSSFTLADLFFELEEYVPSGLYYDSAMVVIDEHYPNYEVISKRYESISRLVGNLLRVETEDSLQRLAALPELELNALINNWIMAEKKKAEHDASMSAQGQYGSANYRYSGQRMLSQQSVSSSWYFYNPSTVAYGKKDFQNLWGDRKLEDNWRRVDKTESMEMGDDDVPEAEALAELADKKADGRASDPTKPEFYKQDIPFTDELMEKSHNMIRDALFDAGGLFKNEFRNYPQAIACFRELDRRYSDNMYKLPSYFYLWDLYNIVNKPDSSNYFKNWIINNHPQSNYAKFLINPNYFVELEAKKDSINQLYQSAFNAYKTRNFPLVKQSVDRAMVLEPDTMITPKLYFLRMIATSRSLPSKQFSDSLGRYIAAYPKTETAELAGQIQGLIKDEKLTDRQQLIQSGYINEFIQNMELFERKYDVAEESIAKWDADGSLLHYFVIAIPNNQAVDVNRLKFDLANYNLDHYTSRDFDIELENLNNDTKLIVVRNLDNKESGMIYYLSIVRRPDVFRTLGGMEFLSFIVSNNNYRQMMNDRSYADYLSFFVKNYGSYTKGQFTEEELESPEQLMARKAREERELSERGEFVLVETGKVPFTPDEKPVETYELDYNQPHSVAIYIKQKGFRTGLLMRSFVQHNSIVHRDKRLRVSPGMASEGSLLLISSFVTANDARAYLIDARDRKELFQSIGGVPYSIFSITARNLEWLQETGKVDEYEQFHARNYMQRRPPNQADAIKPSAQKTDTVQQVAEPTVKTEDAVRTSDAGYQATKDPVQKVEQTVMPEVTKAETIKQEQVVAVTTPTVTEHRSTAGSFVSEPESKHKIVFAVPAQSYNSALLVSYIRRFNATSYSTMSFEIETVKLSEQHGLIVVAGLENKETALSYLKGISSDQRVSMSLRNTVHNIFAITENNLGVLRETVDLEGYLSYFREQYAK